MQLAPLPVAIVDRALRPLHAPVAMWTALQEEACRSAESVEASKLLLDCFGVKNVADVKAGGFSSNKPF